MCLAIALVAPIAGGGARATVILSKRDLDPILAAFQRLYAPNTGRTFS